MSSSDAKTHILDAKGLTCPEPVMLLHGAVRDAREGDTILMEATDPSTLKDVPKFCQYLGHELRSKTTENEIHTFEILKAQR